MIAKVIWNTTKTYSGITTPLVKVSVVVSLVTPARKALEKPPMKLVSEPPPVKARL